MLTVYVKNNYYYLCDLSVQTVDINHLVINYKQALSQGQLDPIDVIYHISRSKEKKNVCDQYVLEVAISTTETEKTAINLFTADKVAENKSLLKKLLALM